MQDSRLMREMFSVVAPRYDFITRAFSYGMDAGWKRLALDLAELPDSAHVLDLASGTGDFSRLVEGERPDAQCVAADLTFGMLPLARKHGVRLAVCADALSLPFGDEVFDAVFVGYGLRNFPRLETALSEIRRVLKPGGALATLDFYLPRNPLWRSVYLSYLYAQGVWWGTVLHRRPRTYTYIPDSLRSFLTVDQMTSRLSAAGYGSVVARSFIYGGIGVHRAFIAPGSRRHR